MNISILTDNNSTMFSVSLPEGATIYDVMEIISGLLTTIGYNYQNVAKAHEYEAERMNVAIERKEVGNE